jgi:Mg2+/citrate symporter
MKSAARQILVVLIVLAAGTLLGNYQKLGTVTYLGK